MNLFTRLSARAAEGRPVRVGMIGAGKFGSMFLAQELRLPGIHVVGVADLNPAAARSNMAHVGWPAERLAAASLDDAARTGATHVGEDAARLIDHPAVEVVVECTGHPVAAVDHCLAAFAAGKAVVNVTVEADAFCGPGLARKAAEAGVVYSMAYGDQPALVCDLVDWARACGFTVVAAGRGHKWLPHFRKSTPETVWANWGLTAEQAARGRLNPKMFNAFLDGSKPAIESSAIANATGLDVPAAGLAYPPGSAEDIPNLMRPASAGGHLEREGMVEVISSLRADGTEIPYNVRQGVWVCFRGETDYVSHCFEEYGVRTDDSGRYAALYKRWHMIGLELPISIAAVALRGEATGVATCFNADVPAIAKRDLAAGEILDGEGGSTVAGGLRRARDSVRDGLLPLGLSQGARLLNPVRDGEPVRYRDVAIDETSAAFRLRKSMEAA